MSVLQFPSEASEYPEQMLSDTGARQEALDIGRSFIVEAPAGSGKTGLLIQRYLRLLRIVDQPESVLALTFTNKATAEMRHRVLAALQAARTPLPADASPYDRETWTIAREVLQQEANRRWDLQAQPHRLNLRTIDSLCGEIARGVPVLSGGVGNATPLTDAEPLYRAAARTVLLQLGGEDHALNRALETVLQHRDADLADCETLIAEMLATREQWGSLVPLSRSTLNDATLDAEVLPRLNAALEQVLCGALTELRNCFPEHLLQEAASIAHMLADAEGYDGAPNPIRACATMPHAPGTAADDVEHWKHLAHLLTTPSGGWRKAMDKKNLALVADKREKARLLAALDDLRHDEALLGMLCAVRDLPPSTYPPDQWVVAKALFTVLHHALVELRLLFAEREVCDFTELSIAARLALRNGEGAAEALNLRLEHLLVDEMQDTSSAQYELLEALTADWDGRTQTVFLVGDPKQSIYLFRQARVEHFMHSMRSGRLGNVILTPLQLTSNFRSGGALVRKFNAAFERVFAQKSEIRYTAATPALPPTTEDALDWTVTPLEDGSPLQVKQSRREEAEAIAAFAHHWRARPAPGDRHWKIAVLVRGRNHAAETMRALALAEVPFRAVEMEVLGERPEILDLLSLTRALSHPADRTAWLAVLRAPWCGLSLADLHTLAAGDDPALRKQALRPHLRQRAELLAPEARARALRTLDVLDRLIDARGRSPVSVDVDRAWTALRGDQTTDALGRSNVQRYLELLESMEAEGEPIQAASLTLRLEKLYAEPRAVPDAVEVLTIHKAKGLEWDAVLLPGLHRGGGTDRTPLLDWMELPPGVDGMRQVLLAPIAKRGDDPDSLNRFVRKARTRAQEAELQRVFYVAATRARTSLQLYASPARKQDGTVSVRPGTLLNAAWNVAAEELPPVASPMPLGGEAIVFPTAIELQAPALALAASAGETENMLPPGAEIHRHSPVLQRLPLAVIQSPGAQPTLRPDAARSRPEEHLVRPQGSIAARVLGTTVHAFLLLLAEAGQSLSDPAQLADHVRGWLPRLRAVARTGGLAPKEAELVAQRALTALENTLTYEPGAWLFEAHAGARNEGEVTEVLHSGTLARFRFDRSFYAGPEPLLKGEDVLWIVDYKTSTYREAEHAGTAREEFLTRERGAYEPHLRNYARLLLRDQPAGTPVMLALYYPLLPYLDAFPYDALNP